MCTHIFTQGTCPHTCTQYIFTHACIHKHPLCTHIHAQTETLNPHACTPTCMRTHTLTHKCIFTHKHTRGYTFSYRNMFSHAAHKGSHTHAHPWTQTHTHPYINTCPHTWRHPHTHTPLFLLLLPCELTLLLDLLTGPGFALKLMAWDPIGRQTAGSKGPGPGPCTDHEDICLSWKELGLWSWTSRVLSVAEWPWASYTASLSLSFSSRKGG